MLIFKSLFTWKKTFYGLYKTTGDTFKKENTVNSLNGSLSEEGEIKQALETGFKAFDDDHYDSCFIEMPMNGILYGNSEVFTNDSKYEGFSYLTEVAFETMTTSLTAAGGFLRALELVFTVLFGALALGFFERSLASSMMRRDGVQPDESGRGCLRRGLCWSCSKRDAVTQKYLVLIRERLSLMSFL